MKLDIGSGTNPYGNGFITVDPYQDDAEVHAPMQALPYADGSVAAIYCAHALEHIGWAEVGATLLEWHRVLAPRGELLLRVPDLTWCINHWCEHRDDPWALAKIFGSQEHEGNVHRCGFDEAGWARHLVAAGFTIISWRRVWSHEQEGLEFTCRK